ncbi:MAG: hypothetical protein AAFV25_23800, partial [Bacteroidota bacterium]
MVVAGLTSDTIKKWMWYSQAKGDFVTIVKVRRFAQKEPLSSHPASKFSNIFFSRPSATDHFTFWQNIG